MKNAARIINEIRRVSEMIFMVAVMIFIVSSPVRGADVNITAEFKPDISDPGNNKFKNTTKNSGFCVRYPGYCSNGRYFSVAAAGFSAEKFYDMNSEDLKKNHIYHSIDGARKTVRLKNTKTGYETNVQFRVNVFSVRTNGMLKAGGYVYPISGCGYVGTSNNGSNQTTVTWTVPERKLDCNTKLTSAYTLTNNGTVTLYELSFGYDMVTPNPLELPAGEYTGEYVYTIGDGQDIDLHALSYNDNEIRFKFKITVEHAFFYRFPPGSERVLLTPPRGWSEWINGGRVPDRLVREVPFTLSSSGGFKVWMKCEHTGGTGCLLKNQDSSETVPLDVLMTLPGFRTEGREASHVLLTNRQTGHVIDPPGTYVQDRRAKLDFRVNGNSVREMVKQPGSRWKGTVTVIMDSQVD